MPVASQRGTPVIYVAGSARELPAEVQEWLGRAENRAVASPHIYDMLAQLARGSRYAALIINIQSIDWSEMEFFDLAGRLSGRTPIYVTGGPVQRAKLDAACRRGARLFDAEAISDEVTMAQQAFALSKIGGESPAAATGIQPEASRLSAAPAEAHVAEAAEERSEWTARVRIVAPIDEPADVEVGPVMAAAPDPEPAWVPELKLTPVPPGLEPIESEPEFEDRLVEGPVDVPAPVEASGSEGLSGGRLTALEGESAPSETAAQAAALDTERMPASSEDPTAPGAAPVRLAPKEEEENAPVMFPWTVNPNRPRRIPPQAGTGPTTGGEGDPLREARRLESPFRSVKLTPEEIAALMGQRPSGPEAPAPEARS